jgi:hypothetical protein
MTEKAARKTFSTAEEAGVDPPTEAEIMRARTMFNEFQQQVDDVTGPARAKEISSKFWDDVSGTEYDTHGG